MFVVKYVPEDPGLAKGPVYWTGREEPPHFVRRVDDPELQDVEPGRWDTREAAEEAVAALRARHTRAGAGAHDHDEHDTWPQLERLTVVEDGAA